VVKEARMEDLKKTLFNSFLWPDLVYFSYLSRISVTDFFIYWIKSSCSSCKEASAFAHVLSGFATREGTPLYAIVRLFVQ